MVTPVGTVHDIDVRREAAGLPYRLVCQEAGVSPSTWRRIMAGQHSPVLATLQRLSDAIDRLTTEAAAE